MEADKVSETLRMNYILTWLVVRENFIVLKASNFVHFAVEVSDYNSPIFRS
jgi:hypothetical protein